jgi:hypothetical protein
MPRVALGISNIVYGREHGHGKVYYCVDPTGQNTEEKAIPESVVLLRWRRRQTPAGYRFSGDRLGPNAWRAMAIVFKGHEHLFASPDLESIRSALAAHRPGLRDDHFTLPSAQCLQVMFRALGPERTNLLIARHTSADRVDRYGTPDLFLYATSPDRPDSPLIRFVEVKKPRERTSDDQLEEIAFLNSLGLPARVLRLIER